MAYKALYRKYRPSFFNQVVGQEAIIKTLKNSIKENKISHAYLFTGTRGTGKTTVAKIFAKTVNCMDINDGVPCEKCNICMMENIDKIQDIIEIDAASNNGVDEIREIKSKVNLVPTQCKYKVYIIDEVHMLSIGAFNALLKTLEEPPMHVIFILATTEPQKLPATIISRCQRYDFKKIPIKDVKGQLEYIAQKEGIVVGGECLEEIAKLGDGSMRDSIGLLEQVSSYSKKDISIEDIYDINGSVSDTQLADVIKMLKNSKMEELLDLFDTLYDKGKDFERLVESLMLFLRNMLIYKNASKYFENKNISNKEIVIETAKSVEEEFLLKMIRETNLLLADIKKSSHPNILFELFIFKIIGSTDNNTKEEKLEVKEVEQKAVENQPIVKINTVEKEFTSELKIDLLDIEKSTISGYKKALINNTIALADKEEMKLIQESWKKLQTFLIKKKYKEVATILLDSKISAVSKDHILLTYKYDSMVDCHDRDTKKIEELVENMIEKKYKIVAITETCWNDLRPYYVELKKKNKKIDVIEEIEPQEIVSDKKKELDPLIDNAINAFGEELIEMEG